MSERASDLVVGVSGIVFLVGAVVGLGVLVGSVPGPGATDAEIGDFLARSEARVWAGGYVGLLGLVAFLIFAGSLWRLLRAAEGEPGWLSATALAAAAGVVAVTIAGDLVPGAAAFHGGSRAEPSTVALLLDMKKFAEMLAVPLTGVFLGCTGVVALRTGVLSRWAGWSAVGIAAISAIALPLGYEPSQIPVFLTALWILAVSVRFVLAAARGGRPLVAARVD